MSATETSHTSAGYSGKPLSAKLGLKKGMRAAFIGAPEHLPMLLEDVWVDIHHDALEVADYVHVFAHSGDDVRALAVRLSQVFDSNEVLWISWPKKTSGVPTDITEDCLREWILPTGLVDVKVCAVDATWSALKFVLRKELRTVR